MDKEKHGSQVTVGRWGLTLLRPLKDPNSVSFGHSGSFPVIHHQRGRDRGLQPRSLISSGSLPNDSEKALLSASSILVHSRVHTAFFESLKRCSGISRTVPCRHECFPGAPFLLAFNWETSLQGIPPVNQSKAPGCFATALSSHSSPSVRTSPNGTASGQWAQAISIGSLAISLK